MCAISGLLTDQIQPDAARHIVRQMNEAQRHRGPDGEGVWDDGRLFLGHRRLAIIDLSECGAQPMINEDGTVVLVCNGEIYNFRELRTDLLQRGHRFKSNTDIEVILHLYEEKGDECVRDLVGMFAFAIWDTRSRHLLLARDRVGEKPLHYTCGPKSIAFASELSALLPVPSTDTKLDVDGVAASLIYPSSPAPLTMFAGIRSLPPAARLTVDDGRIRVDRYWWIDCSRRRNIRERDAVEELDTLMSRAVRGALIADVPVGVLLSGGVDSSVIALHASRGGADVQAFSVGHDSPDHPDPDLARARQVAKRLALSHHEISLPPPDSSCFPESSNTTRSHSTSSRCSTPTSWPKRFGGMRQSRLEATVPTKPLVGIGGITDSWRSRAWDRCSRASRDGWPIRSPLVPGACRACRLPPANLSKSDGARCSTNWRDSSAGCSLPRNLPRARRIRGPANSFRVTRANVRLVNTSTPSCIRI